MEEDAGKNVHGVTSSYVNFNRSGIPLIEIVSTPDLRSSKEAYEYLRTLKTILEYLNISDCNMEEGSLRCDANISVRKKGDTKLGTKVEVKNLNSIRYVKRAIETEANRLINVLENGGEITQETRGFDANTGFTFSIREKEDADDYRYFPEPDLTPFNLQDEFIEKIQKSMPVLQEERIKQYTSAFGLSEYDAAVLTEEKAFAGYFENIVQHTRNYKAAANWMMGPIKSWLNENSKAITEFPLTAHQLATIINMTDAGKISFSSAAAKLFPRLLQTPGKNPEDVAVEENLIAVSDMSFIGPLIDKVLDKFAGKVVEYKKGKKGLLALFVGEVMKQSKGKADPETVNKIIFEKLNK
jgi:aspartyl-tRNA(Asn)/glutamyl-tRNA(Gln) amidotransferase subunit B